LSGTVTINGLLEALGGLVVQTSLSIETKTDFNDNALDNVGPITGSGGTLNVVGGLSVSGNEAVTGNLGVSGTLTAAGAAVFSSTVTFNGLVTFASTPVNFGNAALTNIGSLSPTAGLLTITSGVSLGGTLDLNGAAIIDASSITPQGGTLTINGTQVITGALTIGGVLTANGAIALNGAVTFASSPVNFGGAALTNVGSLAAVGPSAITLNSSIMFAPGAEIGGSPLTTSTALAVNGGLAVTGPSTFSGGVISFSGNAVTNVLSFAPSGAAIDVLGDLDLHSHNLVHVAGLSTPAAGTFTLSGTNVNVTALTSTFANLRLQNGSQAAGYILQSAADGTGTWVAPTSVSKPIGCLVFSGAYNLIFGVLNTPTEIAAGGVGALLNVGFTSPGDVGRLLCAFGVGISLQARVTIAVTYSSLVVGLAGIVFAPAIDGVLVPGVESANSFTGPLTAYATATLTFTATLVDGNYISLFCTNNSLLGTVTIYSMQISVA
jgi:hypothetical protein